MNVLNGKLLLVKPEKCVVSNARLWDEHGEIF